MMTIKTMWFYAALATAICGGAGLGAGAVAYSSKADMERAIMEARSNCEPTPAEHQWKQGKFRERGTKGF